MFLKPKSPRWNTSVAHNAGGRCCRSFYWITVVVLIRLILDSYSPTASLLELLVLVWISLKCLHPGRLTWNLQITHLERNMIFQTSMIMFHVNLQGCIKITIRTWFSSILVLSLENDSESPAVLATTFLLQTGVHPSTRHQGFPGHCSFKATFMLLPFHKTNISQHENEGLEVNKNI